MRLDPAAAAAGVRLAVRETVGSTNAEALALARAGESGPLWFVARKQTAGRGRHGRGWVSEPGNLYASLLLTDPAPREHAAELSFVSALAVYDAVAAVAFRQMRQLALKWPNDVLMAGKKLSGILIEGEGVAVAIGIGINCAHHPQETSYPATDLETEGLAQTPETMFSQLSATMMRRMAQWNGGRGFDAIRGDWLARAAGIGEMIQLSMSDGEHTGVFESIDESGRLVLRYGNGSREAVTAGDVVSIGGAWRSIAAAGR